LGGDLMDAVSLKLARNYTNEKLNSLPSNRPTKTVTFDGGIYSVGNDVVNGQVSCVIKGNTVQNILPDIVAECQSTSGWGAYQTRVTTDSDNKYSGTHCLKIMLNAGYNVGTLNRSVLPLIDKNKYYMFSAYVKNGNLSGDGIRASLSCVGDVVEIPGTNITSTNYTRTAVLLKPSDMDTATDVRLYMYLNGAENEYAFIDAIMLNEITAEEYALGASALLQKYNWHLGTKSTNSVRIRSVNEDETKESIVYVNLTQGEELRSLPNGVKDEVNVTKGIKTQRVSDEKIIDGSGSWSYFNSTFPNVYRAQLPITPYSDALPATSNTINAFSDDGSYLSMHNFYADFRNIIFGSGAEEWVFLFIEKVKIDAMPSGGTLAGFKEYLNRYPITLTYQLATPIVTKLPAQAPLQVFENGTVYVEPIGDASESTLPTVELTIPTGTSNKFGVATHDYGGAAADWVLTKNEANCGILIVTNAGGAANIIAPNDLGRFFFVKNDSGYDVVVKSAGAEAGTTIADGNSVIVFNTGD
jgi:hypothetical protein